MKHPRRRWKWEKFRGKWVILEGNKSFVSSGCFVVIELVFRENEAAYCGEATLVNERKAKSVSQELSRML